MTEGCSVEEGGWDKHFNCCCCFLFSSSVCRARRAGVLSLPSNYIRSLGWEMRETTMWGRVFQGCYFIVFGSSEMLLHCTRVEKITKSLSVHPLTQALAAKIGQESCQTCSASHPPMRQSSADLGEHQNMLSTAQV